MELIKFPRTKHLVNLGSVTRDDLVMSAADVADLLKLPCVIEEKIDGANLGFRIDPETNKIIAQNRSHFVSSAYHAQFKPLDEWIYSHMDDLWTILTTDAKPGQLILYGEWMRAKHSIHYTKLPDVFIAYDVYDTSICKFWSRSRFESVIAKTSISHIHKIAEGTFSLSEVLKYVATQSVYCDGLIEGIVLRWTDDMWLNQRAKIVRQNFIAGDDHWTKGKLTLNDIIHD